MSKFLGTDPAHPVMHPNGTSTGMDIRTTLAGKILAAILIRNKHISTEYLVDEAVEYADKLIKKLNHVDTKL